jgi:hypothetical protein
VDLEAGDLGVACDLDGKRNGREEGGDWVGGLVL